MRKKLKFAEGVSDYPNCKPRIAEKKAFGMTVGFVVGYPINGYSWRSQNSWFSFRSIREGLIFKTRDAAEKWRDKMESKRVENETTFEVLD